MYEYILFSGSSFRKEKQFCYLLFYSHSVRKTVEYSTFNIDHLTVNIQKRFYHLIDFFSIQCRGVSTSRHPPEAIVPEPQSHLRPIRCCFILLDAPAHYSMLLWLVKSRHFDGVIASKPPQQLKAHAAHPSISRCGHSSLKQGWSVHLSVRPSVCRERVL